jgi:hypothetical protein
LKASIAAECIPAVEQATSEDQKAEDEECEDKEEDDEEQEESSSSEEEDMAEEVDEGSDEGSDDDDYEGERYAAPQLGKFDPKRVLANLTREQLRERQVAVLKACGTPFALLLDHFYSQNTPASQLRGGDAHLYSLFSSMPDLHLTLLPVMVVVKERGRDEDDERPVQQQFDFGYRYPTWP